MSIAAALLCAELFLRWFSPIFTTGIQGAYQYDKALGIRLRDSAHLFRTTDHQEEIVSNPLGTANFQHDFASYPQLVFALGDSYTQGTGLSADQSYPFQLDLILNQDSSGSYRKEFGVVNLGLASYGAEQSLLVLERYSARLGNPAVCLYLGSDNDFDDDLLFKSGSRHRHVVAGSPRYGRLVPFLTWAGDLQVVLRLKLLLASHRLTKLRAGAASASPRPRQKLADSVPRNLMSGDDRSAPRSVAEIEWPVIERIVDACQARGAPTIVSWSARPHQSLSYAWLREQAHRKGIEFNDWQSRADQVRVAIPSLPLENPHSGAHYRGWVNGEIAKGFESALRALRQQRPQQVRSDSPIR